MRVHLHILLPFYVVLSLGRPAFAADCPQVYAPQTFAIKGDTVKPTATPQNRGIVANGFVGLASGVSVVHGIDVSKWQPSADFVRAKQCGAKFAYVRLSAGTRADNELEYRSHWSNARSVKLMVGPYHNLTLIDSEQPYASLPAPQQQALIDKNVAAARVQARLLMNRLHEVLSLDPLDGGASNHHFGQPYLPIALDVSARPQLSAGIADRIQFGRAYGAAVCAWLDEIKQDRRLKDQQLLMFTLPSVYKDYRLNDAPCDLQSVPVWLSYRPLDGDMPEKEKDEHARAAIAALCGAASGPGRCRFQQYTSWGGFALYDKNDELDLDRFIGTESELRNLLQRAIRGENTYGRD